MGARVNGEMRETDSLGTRWCRRQGEGQLFGCEENRGQSARAVNRGGGLQDVRSRGYSPRFSQFGQLGQRTQAAHGAAPQAGLVGGGARAGAGGSGGVDLAGF